MDVIEHALHTLPVDDGARLSSHMMGEGGDAAVAASVEPNTFW
jgi:hypothetical protein